MKKLLLGLFCIPLIVIGQTTTTETFTGFSTAPNDLSTNTSYGAGSAIGVNGIQWSFIESLNAGISTNTAYYPIDGDGILLRRNNADSLLASSLKSAAIQGGISQLTFKYRKAFTSASVRTFRVKITEVATNISTYHPFSLTPAGNTTEATIYDGVINGLSIQGDFTIDFRSVGSTSNQQITIDDVAWTSYVSSTPEPCSIDNVTISALTCDNNGTEAVTTDDRVKFTLNVAATEGGANGYSVSTSEYALVGTSTGTFGAPVEFMLEEGSVGGLDFTITVTSVDSTSCTYTSATVVNETVECSTPPTTCSLGAPVVTDVLCNTGADINVATDDFIALNLNVTGQLTSANGYIIAADNGTLNVTTGTYGTIGALQISNATASTIVLTITDADDVNCTTTVTITNPGTCSGDAVIYKNNVSSLSFTGIEGNTINAQSVSISGAYLTTDVTATATTGFEVSADATTYGATATFTLPANTNTLPASPLSIRPIGSVIGTTTGTVTLSSALATDSIINLTSTIEGYVSYTIDEINGTTTDGIPDSLNVLVELAGIVQCMDYRAAGYSMVMVDGSNKGINVYKGSNITGYETPAGGDSIIVKGKIIHFRGLLQIEAASITLVNTGNAQATPMIATELNETTENFPVTIENVTIVPNQPNAEDGVWPTGANIQFTSNGVTFDVRAANTPLAGQPLPLGPVTITGIGSQFSNPNSAPFNNGYQLLICNADAIEIPCVGTNVPNTNVTSNNGTFYAVNAGSYTYQWIDCDTDLEIVGATTAAFTPTQAGNYKVFIDNGNCSATSTCQVSTLSIENTELGKAIVTFPNPVNDQLTINNYNTNAVMFTITDINGKVINTTSKLSAVEVINTTSWNKGIYFVQFIAENNATHTIKVVK